MRLLKNPIYFVLFTVLAIIAFLFGFLLFSVAGNAPLDTAYYLIEFIQRMAILSIALAILLFIVALNPGKWRPKYRESIKNLKELFQQNQGQYHHSSWIIKKSPTEISILSDTYQFWAGTSIVGFFFLSALIILPSMIEIQLHLPTAEVFNSLRFLIMMLILILLIIVLSLIIIAFTQAYLASGKTYIKFNNSRIVYSIRHLKRTYPFRTEAKFIFLPLSSLMQSTIADIKQSFNQTKFFALDLPLDQIEGDPEIIKLIMSKEKIHLRILVSRNEKWITQFQSLLLDFVRNHARIFPDSEFGGINNSTW